MASSPGVSTGLSSRLLTLDPAEDVSEAMYSRGFSDGNRPTLRRQPCGR